MNWNRKVITMVLLVATLLTAGVAAMPATLSSPTLPMNWNRKVITMVLLVATLLTAGVAAMPATLSSPTLPTVIATANPGEL